LRPKVLLVRAGRGVQSREFSPEPVNPACGIRCQFEIEEFAHSLCGLGEKEREVGGEGLVSGRVVPRKKVPNYNIVGDPSPVREVDINSAACQEVALDSLNLFHYR
jgi:hypothetical protein